MLWDFDTFHMGGVEPGALIIFVSLRSSVHMFTPCFCCKNWLSASQQAIDIAPGRAANRCCPEVALLASRDRTDGQALLGNEKTQQRRLAARRMQ